MRVLLWLASTRGILNGSPRLLWDELCCPPLFGAFRVLFLPGMRLEEYTLLLKSLCSSVGALVFFPAKELSQGHPVTYISFSGIVLGTFGAC